MLADDRNRVAMTLKLMRRQAYASSIMSCVDNEMSPASICRRDFYNKGQNHRDYQRKHHSINSRYTAIEVIDIQPVEIIIGK